MELLKKIPVLGKGCRLSEQKSETLLLLPEGIVKLSAGGVKVLRLCNGERATEAVVVLLQAEQPDALHERVQAETLQFLEGLSRCRAIDLR